jgi:thioredoxin 1
MLLEWLKTNWVMVLLAGALLWLAGSRLWWLVAPIKEDPNSPVKHFTSADWNQEVLQAKKPVLVDFWAAWCPPCRAQGPIIEELAKQVSGTAVVGKLDVDKNQEIAGAYGVSGIPSLLIFKKGKVAQRFTGLTSADELKKALAEASF